MLAYKNQTFQWVGVLKLQTCFPPVWVNFQHSHNFSLHTENLIYRIDYLALHREWSVASIEQEWSCSSQIRKADIRPDVTITMGWMYFWCRWQKQPWTTMLTWCSYWQRQIVIFKKKEKWITLSLWSGMHAISFHGKKISCSGYIISLHSQEVPIGGVCRVPYFLPSSECRVLRPWSAESKFRAEYLHVLNHESF